MIQLGIHRIDVERGTVHTPEGDTQLSDKERALLALLAPSAGTPVPREALIAALWPNGLSERSRAPDVLFSRLRARVEPPGESGRYLKTIRNEGYLLSLPTPDHTAGPQPSRLVGRADELARAQTWLHDSAGRWLTWIGMGGIGKTRLATAFATASAAAGRSVAWVDLAPLLDGDGPYFAVARALGLDIKDADDLEAALRVGLGTRRTLLFLDNLEHLPRASTRLGELLIHAPGVRVVATSRRALGVEGEAVFRLAGLGPIDGPAFFRERARSVVPLQASSLDDAIVDAVCEAVSGHPLALELAVATLRFRPPAHLLATLRERIHALVGEAGGRDPRQASIEATFAYSWDMLSPDQRRALVALSQFAGRFTNEQAMAATGTAVQPIHSLVRHSLVASAPGGGRALHPLVRSFAAARRDQLDPDGDLAHRYRHYFLGWASSQISALRADQNGEAPRSWRVCAPDIDAAWADAVARADLAALTLGWPGLREWIEARECIQEVRDWCRPALNALAGIDSSRELRHELLAAESSVRLTKDDPALAGELLSAIADEPPGATHVRLVAAAGTVAARQLRTEEGVALLLQAEKEAKAIGDLNLLGRVQYAQWGQHVMRARTGPGLEVLQDCESTFRAVGNHPMLRRVLGGLGAALCSRDRLDEADAILAEALALCLAADDGPALARARLGVLLVRRRQGNAEESIVLCELVEQSTRERGDLASLVARLRFKAMVLLDLGRIEESEAASAESLELAYDLGLHVRAASALDAVSHARLARGDHDGGLDALLEMRAVLMEHLPEEAYWDVVCSGNLACAQWLAGDLLRGLENAERAATLASSFSQHIQGQTEIAHAVLLAEAGMVARGARRALGGLPKLAKLSDWAVWRCAIQLGVILERGGQAPLAAALLPLLREDKGSPEKWIYLPPFEKRLAGIEPAEPPFVDRNDAIARVTVALEELAAGS